MDEFKKVDVYIRRKSALTEDIADAHDTFMRRMMELPGPLGFAGAQWTPAPTFDFASDGEQYSTAPYNVKGRMRGVQFIGNYRIIGIYGKHKIKKAEDNYYHDDTLHYRWKLSNKLVDYEKFYFENLPAVLEIFGARYCSVHIRYYDQAYHVGCGPEFNPDTDRPDHNNIRNQAYLKVHNDPYVDVDGWNNIFTLYPVQFWERGRCIRALGYGPEEVLRRLDGRVPIVRILQDGVYLVLNENPNLTYKDFLEMNRKFKAILQNRPFPKIPQILTRAFARIRREN